MIRHVTHGMSEELEILNAMRKIEKDLNFSNLIHRETRPGDYKGDIERVEFLSNPSMSNIYCEYTISEKHNDSDHQYDMHFLSIEADF